MTCEDALRATYDPAVIVLSVIIAEQGYDVSLMLGRRLAVKRFQVGLNLPPGGGD